MAFNNVTSIAPLSAKPVTPVSAIGRIDVVHTNLRAAAASAANLRNPIGAALSTGNLVDIRGVTSFRLFGRVSNLASLNFSATNPKVAVYLVWLPVNYELKNVDGSDLAANATHIERVDQDGSAATGGIEVPFYEATAEPTSSNRIVLPGSPGWLITKPLQWTGIDGVARNVFNARGASLLLAQIATAAGGSAVTGESSQLIAEGIN